MIWRNKMSREEILEKLKEILEDVLDVSCDDFTEETIRKDVDEWDSLAHINVVMSMESEFEIKFTLQEVNEMSDIGKIVSMISERVN